MPLGEPNWTQSDSSRIPADELRSILRYVTRSRHPPYTVGFPLVCTVWPYSAKLEEPQPHKEAGSGKDPGSTGDASEDCRYVRRSPIVSYRTLQCGHPQMATGGIPEDPDCLLVGISGWLHAC